MALCFRKARDPPRRIRILKNRRQKIKRKETTIGFQKRVKKKKKKLGDAKVTQ